MKFKKNHVTIIIITVIFATLVCLYSYNLINESVQVKRIVKIID